MKVLITGYTGFIGSNLEKAIKSYGHEIKVIGYNSKNSKYELNDMVKECDFVYELAAVHRPKNPKAFSEVNTGILKEILDCLDRVNPKCSVLYTSSIQAIDDTDYGRSKYASEKLLIEHAKKLESNIFIYRLTNTFGPGARPNGHSVVATFCNDLAMEKDIRIDDASRVMNFQYISDVTKRFISHLFEQSDPSVFYYQMPDEIITSITIGELAELLQYFSKCCKEGAKPQIVNEFQRRLLYTYKTYLNNVRKNHE